jgi:hypothetical protein
MNVTEAEWLACEDPQKMLKMLSFLRRLSLRASDRKFRLFACACCRPIDHFLKDERSRKAVEIAERFAEGAVTAKELFDASNHANNACDELATTNRGVSDAETDASNAANSASFWEGEPIELAMYTSHRAAHALSYEGQQTAEKRSQCQLLSDIFGPLLFRSVEIDPHWLLWNDGTVVKLAQAAYEERQLPEGTLDNTRLLILADALEEAGCSDADILGHLRGPGPHVRGCWVVDLLLGKS